MRNLDSDIDYCWLIAYASMRSSERASHAMASLTP